MKQQIYLAWGKDKYMINCTANPEFDLQVLSKYRGYLGLAVISGWLPFGLIDFACQRLQVTRGFEYSIKEKFVRRLFNTSNKIGDIKKGLFHKYIQLASKKPYLTVLREPLDYHINESYIMPSGEDAGQVLKILQGRLLFVSDIEKALAENNISLNYPLGNILQYLYLREQLELRSAVTLNAYEEHYCARCGQSLYIVKATCPECRTACYYCENCQGVGVSRLCEILYTAKTDCCKRPHPVVVNSYCKLSPAQAMAYKGLKDFVRDGKGMYALVWAVCGAGKTEVSYAAIEEILKEGGRVLYAVPRRDVVIELDKRLRQAFPCESIISIYGGSPYKFRTADLILATTHQCLRFNRAFDLVILDESDAYPFAGNKMLYEAVERAKKPEGRMIYMTATPDREILQKNPWCLKIPARHHGLPLPVPKILLKKGKGIISPEALGFLDQCKRQNKQVFIFVPTVKMAKEVCSILKKIYYGDVRYSHSGDKSRDKKRQDFMNGVFGFFVTTSIMERGVTVANVNVLVLGADNEQIFDERALIQMAGRVGRVKDGLGEVVFSAASLTPAMAEAVRNIRSMNREARTRGLLKE